MFLFYLITTNRANNAQATSVDTETSDVSLALEIDIFVPPPPPLYFTIRPVKI